MEADRAQADLRIAVDIEERFEESAAQRQPKKRFVGRRQAAEAAAKNGPTMIEESGTIQGRIFRLVADKCRLTYN
jgi:2-(3-amino-3-carboxypropyl)histidine synthase